MHSYPERPSQNSSPTAQSVRKSSHASRQLLWKVQQDLKCKSQFRAIHQNVTWACFSDTKRQSLDSFPVDRQSSPLHSGDIFDCSSAHVPATPPATPPSDQEKPPLAPPANYHHNAAVHAMAYAQACHAMQSFISRSLPTQVSNTLNIFIRQTFDLKPIPRRRNWRNAGPRMRSDWADRI